MKKSFLFTKFFLFLAFFHFSPAFIKCKQLPGLIHYWPINEDTYDHVGQADLLLGKHGGFTRDRDGKPGGAISVNAGYYITKPDVIFYSDFTVSLWIKFDEKLKSDRILDCGNGDTNEDRIIIYLGSSNNGLGSLNLWINGVESPKSTFSVMDNEWSYIAVTLNGPNVMFYTYSNDKAMWYLSTAITKGQPTGAKLYKCLLGGTHSSGVPNAIANYDNIKIFNRALSTNEIYKDYTL